MQYDKVADLHINFADIILNKSGVELKGTEMKESY